VSQEAAGPVWTPDGQWIVFSTFGGEADVVRVRADGSGEREVLLPREPARGRQTANSISPDGRLLAFTEDTTETGLDVWVLSLDTRETRRVLGTRFNETAAAFPPDGRLLAYVSDETGHNEVYVQPFPGPGAKRQVSVGGGLSPVWGRQPGEIFYQRGTSLMTVKVRTGVGLEPSAPREVLSGVLPEILDAWDLAPGGLGFVMPRQLDQKQATTLMLALNWSPEAVKGQSP
jgi:dipeptidyl aminopeptidase/acylaminoacyl peptidase